MAIWTGSSVAVQVFGLTSVSVGVGLASGSLSNPTVSSLGYSRNGVFIFADPYFLPVPTDENGGDDGPPTEIQYLGETHRVRLELTKWQQDTVLQLMKRVDSGGTHGTPVTCGTLMFAGTNAFGLKLTCTAVLAAAQPFATRFYPRCVLRDRIEFIPGTKFTTMTAEFECYKNDDGVLFADT